MVVEECNISDNLDSSWFRHTFTNATNCIIIR